MWSHEEIKYAEECKLQALECWIAAKNITGNVDFNDFIGHVKTDIEAENGKWLLRLYVKTYMNSKFQSQWSYTKN